jgi:cobalt-zinc-cadmium efflux system outer membrane protein
MWFDLPGGISESPIHAKPEKLAGASARAIPRRVLKAASRRRQPGRSAMSDRYVRSIAISPNAGSTSRIDRPRRHTATVPRDAKRLLILLMCALCACATYHPAPLKPAEAERRFAQIRIDDPHLCAYLRANLGTGFSTCPPARWNLAELTLVGFYYSPQLAVADAKLNVARAAIITAAERPNPSFGLGPAYTASASPSFAPWAIGAAQMNFPIETAGRRGYRIARAERMADAAAFAVGEAAWRVRSSVRAALLSHLAAQRDYELVRNYESTSQHVASLLQERLAAGAIAAPAVNFALANLAAARLKAVQARSRVPETLNRLAAALGVSVEALNGARFAWPEYAHPPQMVSMTPARVRRLALLNRIDLRRMLAQYAAADDALKLEIARQYPDINLGGGYSWEVGENLFELLPIVTLPLMNQNQGPIAEARARRIQAAAEFVALQDSIIAQAGGALTAYRAALDAFDQASSSAAYSEKRLAGIERAAELGDVNSVALASAHLETIVVQQSKSRALTAAQQDLGALEDAVQRPLEDSNLKSFQLPPLPDISREQSQ